MKGDRTVLDLGCGAGQILMSTDFEPGTIMVGLRCRRVGSHLEGSSTKTFISSAHEQKAFRFKPDISILFYRDLLFRTCTCTKVWPRRGAYLKQGRRSWLVLHPYTMVLKETLEALSRLQIKRVLVCLYVIANGIALNSMGKEFHLPFRRDYHESFQTMRGMRKVLQKIGFDDIKAERNGLFRGYCKKDLLSLQQSAQ